MSKSSKKGSELRESDFIKISDLIFHQVGTRYSTNYIRRVLNESDARKNEIITEKTNEYLSLKKEFEEKLRGN
ncbi:MAG: hypothetical protein JXR03_09535 [Cyclobacteriaceae bacterium]